MGAKTLRWVLFSYNYKLGPTSEIPDEMIGKCLPTPVEMHLGPFWYKCQANLCPP